MGGLGQRVIRRVEEVGVAAFAATADPAAQLMQLREAQGVVIEFFPPEWATRLPPQPSPTWQEQVIARGWAYAILSPTSIQADNGAGLTRGIIGL